MTGLEIFLLIFAGMLAEIVVGIGLIAYYYAKKEEE